jgi:DNA-binding response OmpR family regulator
MDATLENTVQIREETDLESIVTADRKSILVVDDEMSIRKFVRIVLEEQNFQVFEAHDARAALSMIAVKEFDLVISDVRMPKISGIDLLKEVKRQQAGCPVLLVTGVPEVDDALECMKLGAVEYLTKPIDLDRFYSTVANLFDGSEGTLMLTNPGGPNAERYIGGYKILNTLGEGSSGVVSQVEKPDADGVPRQYALKLLQYNSCNDAENRQQTSRFFRELDTLSKIDHPNIVKTHDYGYAENPQLPYFVMDYIRGRSLKLVSKGLVPASIAEKAAIIRQIADALRAIHACDICHRDIKPDSILVMPDLTAILMDFNVAQVPNSDPTVDDQVIGSPAYVSPEGFISGKVDHRADIFSLGAVAYELFLGHRPHDGSSFADFAAAICKEKPYEPRHVIKDFPVALQSILAKMLKKDPTDRYQSADQLVADLDICLDADDIENVPVFDGYEVQIEDWEV